jgi:hypothetical protein
MKKIIIFLACILISGTSVLAQFGISTDGSNPDNSAMLDVKSTTRGVLIPRMTYTQRDAIANPANGLMVFCTNCGLSGALSININGVWRTILTDTALVVPSAPVPGNHISYFDSIIWNWGYVLYAAGYKWNVTGDYSTAVDMTTSTTKTEKNLTCNTYYTRYVWAYNSVGHSDSAILTSHTSLKPANPVAGTHTVNTLSVIWKWNKVPGALGYKWNTTDNPDNAIDLGSDTCRVESRLLCNTPYTRYAWAYNLCGNSISTTLTATTSACPVCGDSLHITHFVSQGAAPVNKSTVYGTKTGVPGEPTKCWITSNLGSDHQATAETDNTEPSAGWYFQFNRKQGYKHDGATRTPNTTWITNINEASDWLLADDPCNNELSNGWRIPTYSEWFNVDGASGGNWTTWAAPWNSSLKIHAAGSLQAASPGMLGYRGLNGTYWSSTQKVGSTTSGSALIFVNSANTCVVGSNLKDYGYTLRCIKP